MAINNTHISNTILFQNVIKYKWLKIRIKSGNYYGCY